MKILVIYAKSGFMGHKVIADNYAKLLKKHGHDVKTGDVFLLDNKTIKSGNKFYLWMIEHAPWIWQTLYFGWLKIPGAKFFKNKIMPRQFKQTQKFVLENKPDLVISTHPSATAVVNYLKEENKYTGKLYTTFSDWHTQPFHVYKNVDKYLLVIKEQVDDLEKLGTPKEKTVVPGMLVDEKYYNLPDKETARQNLNLPLDKKIILVMGGGRGWQMEKTINALTNVEIPKTVILVGGSDERKLELTKNIEAQYPTKKQDFVITGFIEPSLYFAAADLLISKPGGLTSSQAFLSKLPLLAGSPLPGQEDENIKYLVPKGAIALIDKNNLTTQIENLLKNDAKRKEIAAKAYEIAPKNAPEIVLEVIKTTL